MNVISVVPLTRSKVADELSYFTAADVPIGAIVSVPLRRKAIFGIVVDSKSVEEMKIDIKNAPFEIRKLNKVKATSFFPAEFIGACKEIATFYATSLGSVIDAMVSNTILENANKISPPLPIQPSLNIGDIPKPSGKTLAENDRVFVVQGDDADRVSSWRSLIRQEFARKRSISIVVPTVEDGESIFMALEKGIEEYIFMMHGNLTKKKVTDTWAKIAGTDHPVVVISTPSFSLLPRGDFETVIIERENARGWIGRKAPYLDNRYAVAHVAKKRGQTVYLADSMLRAETLFAMENGESDHGSPFKWRSISTATDVIIDMKKDARIITDPQSVSSGVTEPVDPTEKAAVEFKVIGEDLESLIRYNQSENTHLFIMTARRGISPTTVCGDCESIVTCKNCSSPVVLHTSKETGKNFFMCHKCGERRSADENCTNCGGWKLVPLGIGIDLVRDKIRQIFESIEVFQIDSDTVQSEEEAHEIMTRFRAKPGSILLGTEMVLPYLKEKVDHIAIASVDSLLALPDFRIQEKMMYMLIRLRALASRSFLIQTRRPEEKVFEYGSKGNMSDFYRMTKEERRIALYPPYSDLIKITIEGKKEAIAEEMADVQKEIEPYEIDIFPAFTSTVKGKSVIHGLIKAEKGRWPDLDLVRKLRSLSQRVSIKINPESLL